VKKTIGATLQTMCCDDARLRNESVRDFNGRGGNASSTCDAHNGSDVK